MKFENYHFKEYINKALKENNYFEATPIQEEVIPLVLSNQSVIGKSQTGTGKTFAFLLPIIQKLDESLKEVQSVIIVPTRELAMQLFEVLNIFIDVSEKQIDSRIYVGGTNRDSEILRLSKSQPQIVIGTIGKIKDLVCGENILKIHTASIVTIDEADMVFESNEMDDVDSIFCKFKEDIQMLVFSATIPNELVHFLNKYLTKAIYIDQTNKCISKKTIEHVFIPTKNKNKDEILVELLRVINPYLAIIFANTTEKVDDISAFLSQRGFKVAKITGKLLSRERKQVLKRIKDGQYQYVVASDIASRGIDILGVSHVINYELPQDIEFYIHRTGRTARFNFTGQAISFYDYDDDSYLNKLEMKKLKCVYKALKNGQLVETKERNSRQKRDKRVENYEEKLHVKIPLSKKVKPGYKKKRKEEIQKQVKKYQRGKIKEKFIKIQKEKENEVR